MARRNPRVGGKSDGIQWIIDSDDAYKALRTMVKNVDDFRPFWEPIADAVREDNAKRFQSKDGGTWKPLTAKYAKWKAAHAGGAPLMQLEGTLLSAMTEQGDSGQKVSKGRKEMTMRFFAWSGRGKRTNVAAEQTKRGRKVLNANSPYLRKAMGDAAGEVALKWKREWEAS